MNIIKHIRIRIKDIFVDLNLSATIIQQLAGMIERNYPHIVGLEISMGSDEYDLLFSYLKVDIADVLLTALKEIAQVKEISTEKWQVYASRKRKVWKFEIISQ